MTQASQWDFWIDTGGTFTDCLARNPEGKTLRLKVLSSGAIRTRIDEVIGPDSIRLKALPAQPDGFYAGFTIRSAGGGPTATVSNWDATNHCATLAFESPHSFRAGDVVDLSAGDEAPVLAMRLITGTPLTQSFPVAALRLASTRGTNALLEGKCAETAFFVTSGFADLLRIGDQRRQDLFALNPTKPPPLHGPVVEVSERLAADGSVLRPLELESVRQRASELLQRGINVAAVALLHSYRNPAHEQAVAASACVNSRTATILKC